MAIDLVLRTLAAGGEPAVKLANIIQKLVNEASKLGELDIAIRVVSTGQILTEEEADDLPPEQLAAVKDHLVRIKHFPVRWLDRLEDAIERGLLWDRSDDDIVRIMLVGPR
ncbi:hypothetical protein [Bradyrhizobium cosmicum]|uniref:hypothetical protein n=1 Tax=Bradyrhizobium cosmicum TaxID=1404864 RepID=UPI00116353FD|nr:hypothetical protein [Bradyrhizobium cosmicum]QDP20632.1 hypothetical protein FNV92_00020 [Bradyrhizobium cosmicum]QDP20683.1 hypothetical protein FNV92_00295 [Bradyrhizobium cosmicum]